MLFEMMKYKRPQGSRAQEKFCNRFLRPVMGKPDSFGNFIHIIHDPDEPEQEYPDIAFMAHHDTVHAIGGKQQVYQYRGNMFTDGSDCLGADCTTGVWLILKMIEANVPGIYVVHAAEEIGCIGSGKLVKSNPAWLKSLKFAISFDRYGDSSIITHQMGYRTASDEFAESLESILNLGLKADSGGSYTDSNEYRDIVPECTNISVGYDNQHTKYESQDLHYLRRLKDALIAADWKKLQYFRDPDDIHNDPWMSSYYGFGNRTRPRNSYEYYPPTEYGGSGAVYTNSNLATYNKLVKENVLAVAQMLDNVRVDQADLIEYLCNQGKSDVVVSYLRSMGFTFDDVLQTLPMSKQYEYLW